MDGPGPSAKHLGVWLRKYIIPPKLQVFSYKRVSPFPSRNVVCEVVFAASLCPHAYFLSIAVFLSSTAHKCPIRVASPVAGYWRKQMPFYAEQCHCSFLLHTCAFFLLAAQLNFLSSAQDLYQHSPAHSYFTGFCRSSQLPAYMVKKLVVLDSLIAVLISTPCSICCWVMQRGR